MEHISDVAQRLTQPPDEQGETHTPREIHSMWFEAIVGAWLDIEYSPDVGKALGELPDAGGETHSGGQWNLFAKFLAGNSEGEIQPPPWLKPEHLRSIAAYYRQENPEASMPFDRTKFNKWAGMWKVSQMGVQRRANPMGYAPDPQYAKYDDPAFEAVDDPDALFDSPDFQRLVEEARHNMQGGQ